MHFYGAKISLRFDNMVQLAKGSVDLTNLLLFGKWTTRVLLRINHMWGSDFFQTLNMNLDEIITW